MNLYMWLITLFFLGMVAIELCYFFIKACEKI